MGGYTNPTSGTSITYIYDAFERLSSSTPYGGTATTYQYDAISQRVTKTTGSTTNTSIWNDGKIAADYKTVSGNTTLNSYIMGNEGEIISGVLYSNLVTGQGDVLKSINYNTKDETSYDYDAYGNKFCDDTPISPLNYRGQYFDSESGLYYLNARYYDPNTQQFMQEDTYQNDNIEMNLYGYCSANPVLRSDPSGHICATDASEFNTDSITYKALDLLTQSYNAKYTTKKQKKEIHNLADKVRKISREKSITYKNIIPGLNYVEMVIAASDTYKAFLGGLDRETSFKFTKIFYGKTNAGQNGDAFRHAYWSALMTVSCGVEFAKDMADAHEYGYPERIRNKKLYLETCVDLFNNAAGRDFGAAYAKKKRKDYTFVYSLEWKILDRVMQGGLQRVVNGKIMNTDASGQVDWSLYLKARRL